jgi:hypothetical protein
MTNIIDDIDIGIGVPDRLLSSVVSVLAEAADEIERLREALRQLLTVMPVFPDAAKKIVGMEDRYNAALDAARAALKETGR